MVQTREQQRMERNLQLVQEQFQKQPDKWLGLSDLTASIETLGIGEIYVTLTKLEACNRLEASWDTTKYPRRRIFRLKKPTN